MIKKMKKIVLIIGLLIGGLSSKAQVGIGTTTINGDGLMAFEDNNLKAIVLPWVDSSASVSSPVGGTLIYDTSDQKVKYYDGTLWVDMSVNSGSVDTSAQDGLTDIGNGIIIGSTSSSATGVLVLESADKALILPKVANAYTDILSPEPGTIVYDTTSKTICVFNGIQWSFWGESQ